MWRLSLLHFHLAIFTWREPRKVSGAGRLLYEQPNAVTNISWPRYDCYLITTPVLQSAPPDLHLKSRMPEQSGKMIRR